MKKTKKNNNSISLAERILNLRVVRFIRLWSQTRTFPGFYRVSLYDTLKLAYKEAMSKDIFTRSYGVAFSAFISLFPFIIVVFSIISLFPQQDVIAYVERSIHGIMPLNAENFLLDTVEAIVDIPRGGLLSLGFVLALYYSSNAMLTLMRGFDKSYYTETYKNRSFLKERFVATAITVLIGFLFITTLLLIVIGDQFINEILGPSNQDGLLSFTLFVAKWIIVIFSFLVIMGIIYRFGPAMHQKMKIFSPGSIVATLFCIITSVGFSTFVNNFGTYNKVYGSIGATIVVMVWIQLNCLIILFGYEINASIAIQRDLNNIKKYNIS